MNFRDTNPLHPDIRKTWLLELGSDLRSDFIGKYQEGQKEHGGDLGSVTTDQLMKELYYEQLDALAYLAELKRRMDDVDKVTVDRDKLMVLIEMASHLELQYSPSMHAILIEFRQLVTPQTLGEAVKAYVK